MIASKVKRFPVFHNTKENNFLMLLIVCIFHVTVQLNASNTTVIIRLDNI